MTAKTKERLLFVLGVGFFVRKLFGLNWKLSNLISAGTSVNDTASVVASGYALSEIAGDLAMMVKLTRTIAIIPTVLVTLTALGVICGMGLM